MSDYHSQMPANHGHNGHRDSFPFSGVFIVLGLAAAILSPFLVPMDLGLQIAFSGGIFVILAFLVVLVLRGTRCQGSSNVPRVLRRKKTKIAR